MSLINEALRKAQRDRTPSKMPDPGSNPATGATLTGANGMKPGLIIGLVVAVAVLFGLVLGLSLVLFKGGSDSGAAQIAQPTNALPGQVPDQQASNNNSTQLNTTQSTATPPPQLSQIAATQNQPLENTTVPPVMDELRKAREAAEAKAATEAAAAEKAAAEKPAQDIIGWLTTAKVTGVRISETESKVIVNGDAYGIGEYVHYGLGLKVMIIQEKRILFVDENGKKYMKRL